MMTKGFKKNLAALKNAEHVTAGLARWHGPNGPEPLAWYAEKCAAANAMHRETLALLGHPVTTNT